MLRSARVLGNGVPQSSSFAESGSAETAVQERFGAYFTDRELEIFSAQYLSLYQLFSVQNGYKMKPEEVRVTKTDDGYDFTVKVNYGKSKLDRAATVSGDAQFVEDGKLASFRVHSDDGLMKTLQGEAGAK